MVISMEMERLRYLVGFDSLLAASLLRPWSSTEGGCSPEGTVSARADLLSSTLGRR